MSRTMDSTMQAALASNYLRLAIFAQLQFVSSTEYVWSGRGSINWNGETWQGVGDLGAISAISEDSSLTAQGLTISLSGIDPTLLTEALTEIQQGLPAQLWLVLADEQCNPIDSILCYAGRMDQPTIDEGTDTATISIAIENRLSDLQRAQFRRLTDQDQRLKYPNDDGFRFINQLQDWNGSWGSN